ncbi:uncharacterized protein [Rutidosis leptorrhynchoides]|uniref:uncharacterized protein n=1 Tax=Rutidosis leptorrhynchoides TaxID=125765 RepID=UPI003A9A489E
MGRGVRQGDPLSPFLFILAVEGINILTKVAIENNLFKGIEVSNDKIVVSHLQYADDTIFFGEWSYDNIRSLMILLKCLETTSGLKVNMRKSCIYGIGVENNEIVAFSNDFGCNIGSFPFHYLGLPIGLKMRKLSDWKVVLDKVKSRLSDWKARSISFGCRVKLIKSVLSSLPLYYFSIFLAPPCVIKELERRRIGDGSITAFWKDFWLGDSILKQKFSRLYRLETDQDAKVSDRIRWSEGRCKFTWGWSRNIRGRANVDLQVLITLINSYTCSGRDFDEWSWMMSSNGRFTAKKLQCLIEEIYLTDGRGGRETMRNSLVPKKVEIFIWRVLHKRIPVLIELDKRGVDLHSVRCPICDNDVETIKHSLIFCNLAYDTWSRVYKWWGLGNYTNLSINETFCGITNVRTLDMGFKIWQAVEWTCGYVLWKNRNNKVFKNKHLCSASVLNEIQVVCFDWISRRVKGVNLDWHRWLISPHDFLSIR